MSLERRLAGYVLEKHPDRAAIVLERLGVDEAVRLLEQGRVASAAIILQRLSPQFSAAVLEGLDPQRAARVLNALSVDVATRLLRRVAEAPQAAILAGLESDQARNVRALLGFPEGTAGALMDPDVLALPESLTAREALERVRSAAGRARYNVYVVDDQQCLVGAVNLRELLLAKPGSPLSDLMVRDPHRLVATVGRATVLAHPGWKDVHALPVVDRDGAYLGAVRYRTLRALEREFVATRGADLDSGAALGEVVAAAARGLLGAFSGTAPAKGGDDDGA